MSVWLAHLEVLLQQKLQMEDFIFPAIASTGHLKFGECTRRSGFETLMDDIVKRSSLMQGWNGKFTTIAFTEAVLSTGLCGPCRSGV